MSNRLVDHTSYELYIGNIFLSICFPQYMEPYVHTRDVLLEEEYIPTIINLELYTCDVM